LRELLLGPTRPAWGGYLHYTHGEERMSDGAARQSLLTASDTALRPVPEMRFDYRSYLRGLSWFFKSPSQRAEAGVSIA